MLIGWGQETGPLPLDPLPSHWIEGPALFKDHTQSMDVQCDYMDPLWDGSFLYRFGPPEIDGSSALSPCLIGKRVLICYLSLPLSINGASA
jgi:hypothetical protein